MNKQDPVGWLHVYAQSFEHSESLVLGNRCGLKALAAAINAALERGEAESESVFTNDGEGYCVIVKCLDDDAMSKLKEMPYYSHYAESESAHWQARAFEAEAEAYRLRKGSPDPI